MDIYMYICAYTHIYTHMYTFNLCNFIKYIPIYYTYITYTYIYQIAKNHFSALFESYLSWFKLILISG